MATDPDPCSKVPMFMFHAWASFQDPRGRGIKLEQALDRNIPHIRSLQSQIWKKHHNPKPLNPPSSMRPASQVVRPYQRIYATFFESPPDAKALRCSDPVPGIILSLSGRLIWVDHGSLRVAYVQTFLKQDYIVASAGSV